MHFTVSRRPSPSRRPCLNRVCRSIRMRNSSRRERTSPFGRILPNGKTPELASRQGLSARTAVVTLGLIRAPTLRACPWKAGTHPCPLQSFFSWLREGTWRDQPALAHQSSSLFCSHRSCRAARAGRQPPRYGAGRQGARHRHADRDCRGRAGPRLGDRE